MSALVELENGATAAALVEKLREVFGRFGGAEDRGFREALYEWARHMPLIREGGELPGWEELEGGGDMATLLEARARQWEAQWLQEGIEQGIERGRAEGRAELMEKLREVFGRHGGPEDRGFREALYEWARHMPPMRKGGELPGWEELEGGDIATLLEARAREWEAQWLQEGIEQGIERGRAELMEKLREVFGRHGGPEDRGFRKALYEWARHSPPMREGGELPGWEELEGGDIATLLEARAREWEAQWLQEGIECGRTEERALLRRLAARKFGTGTGERLTGLLDGLTDPEQLAEVGDWIIECETGAELLDRLKQGREPG